MNAVILALWTSIVGQAAANNLDLIQPLAQPPTVAGDIMEAATPPSVSEVQDIPNPIRGPAPPESGFVGWVPTLDESFYETIGGERQVSASMGIERTQDRESYSCAEELLSHAVADGFAYPGLKGEGKTLAGVLIMAKSVDKRRSIAEAYWKLALSIARLHFVGVEAALLQDLSAISDVDEQLLNVERTSTIALERQFRFDVLENQYRLLHSLQSYPSNSSDGNLFKTTDVPWVGRYNTRFEKMFARRAALPAALRIHHALPLLRDVITARAAAVVSSQSGLKQRVVAYEGGTASCQVVLDALKELQRQWQEFLESVEQYNMYILEYASIVANPSTTGQQFVSMLIGNPEKRGVRRIRHADAAPAVVLQSLESKGGGRRLRALPRGRIPSLQPVPTRSKQY